jgi:sulfate transport system ATP-binding protein
MFSCFTSSFFWFLVSSFGFSPMSIDIHNITKTFNGYTALKDISLSVAQGELLALLGPSGSGKTTLLRIIAGLESAEAGRVLFADEDVTARNVGSRKVGFVFQHYALFRHMTVFENVAFGLRVLPWNKRPRRRAIKEKVRELLGLVQLEAMAHRYPSQLSGGQRQRVALARALAVEPKVLLLDEPFGALDAKVRRELRRWLRRLHDEANITTVFVTHDQEEALEVADRICVMSNGHIEQIGTPEEVYERPATPFVYNFLGNVNLFHGRVENGRLAQPGTDGGGPGDASSAGAVTYVRPHDVEILQTSADDTTPATIEHITFSGPIVNVTLIGHDASSIEAALTRDHYKELNLASGQKVFVRFKNARTFANDYSI